MKTFAAVLVFAFFLFLVTPGFATDCLIIPGERISDIHVGWTYSDVNKRLGRPDSMRYSIQADHFEYADEQIRVGIMKSTQLVHIVTTDCPCYHLPNGIRVGSTTTEVMRYYGKPQREIFFDDADQWFYLAQGLVFRVQDGRISGISVVIPWYR